jgi:hypothetical protein
MAGLPRVLREARERRRIGTVGTNGGKELTLSDGFAWAEFFR